MITYIDTKNRAKYQVLFEKAEEVLKSTPSNQLPDGIDVDTLEIATLNQYFAYLQDLLAVSSNENIKSYFLRLPLDEELFEINANTRNISIPRSFAANGVGVQGDETAEIVYFSIDRYFDHMDLANEDMNIVIQWETKDKNKETITGISPNFGKDIETIPGKIIFGWPIYSELTESATPIKFAVRFFSLGEANDQGVRALNYSLATLTNEISVGATIDYDLINKTVQEIDRGKMITDRIKNVGIYDPSIPTPQVPDFDTYDLFIDGKEPEIRVADLPEKGDITLKISSHPKDFGAIQYDWRKFAYNSATGEYDNTSNELPKTAIDNGVYEEVTEIEDDLYYRISGVDENDQPIAFTPIVVSEYLEDTTYVAGQGFPVVNGGGYVKLYKKYSTAKVNSVGVYTVRVGARQGVNTVEYKFENAEAEKASGIMVPGPLKPAIENPEEIAEDGIIHIIAQNGAITLSTSATQAEGPEAQVKLTYDWKKLINGVEELVSGENVEEPAMRIYALGQDGHGYSPEDENEEDSIYNQEQITVVQKGTNIIVYNTGEELRTYNSTNSSQGTGKWIGFDIDTKKASLIDPEDPTVWGDTQTLTADDVAESASVGLADGHIIFWAKAENLAVSGGTTIKIDDIELTITYTDEAPSNETYTFSDDKKEIIIEGLPTSGLDEQYVAEVTAERNRVTTSAKSGIYRITNAPEKPVLKRLVDGHQIISDYQDANNLVLYNMKRNGVYRTLSFSVEPIQQSDSLSYIWMRINKEDAIETDLDNGATKLQIDLQDNVTQFLTDLFEDKPGQADIPVDGVYGLTELTNLGEVVDTEDNGPVLAFNDNTPAGIYYCIVVNELNNHRVANVTPFYNIT